ncbi:histidine phosphatase family protein [Arcticibacter tournemirensis]|uniref:Histidine phosphatase family protein n=2 Tax=Arcticibacter tournemirensis TaxID=699437 RepID=A0A4Q0MDS7_9SPHI|nr:histidine phosphatase family protein [Arcticibacter tournemirensis]
MMKKILLVRHAKSDWENSELKDFDRPLNKRGQKNAPEMAGRLLKAGLIPEILVTSPALRALTTAECFADVLSIERSAIIKEPQIYEASSSTLLSIINSLDNKHHFAALIGHNPGLTNLAVNLCDSDIYNIPTCGMVLIHFPFDQWDMISYWTGDQKLYDYPKNVAE